MLGLPGWVPLHRIAVVVAFLVAVGAVWWFERPGGRWGAALRTRFLAGVPWGTLTSVAVVLAVYLFLQGGLGHWFRPVVVSYRAWSYFYPLGMLAASFAHTGPNHLIGNLVGTLTFAPLVEYAWGHFPRDRGSTAFSSLRTNPYVRAFVLFPAGVLLVGLFTSLFAIGPVIGFSGVVFAFAGFALVYYPYATVLAMVAGRVLRTLYVALRSPTLVARSEPTFSSPWWAEIAIQGHAIGLFAGVLVGSYLIRRRGDDRPSPLRLWTGVLLFAVAEALWAVYWFRGGETFVLFRAVGMALVALLATLVAAAVAASDRPLLSRAVGDDDPPEMLDVPRWQAGLALLLVGAAALSGPAVPYNLVSASGDDLPGDPVEVRDYEVTYAEEVPSGQVGVFEFEAFGETTNVTTSGVVVRSRQRGIWTTAVSKGRLAFAGRAQVRLGGPGWRESVTVRRRGWTVVGDNATYRVNLTRGNRTRVAYTAPPARAEPVVGGRNITVRAESDRFLLVVNWSNGTIRETVPERNETLFLGGLRFERENRKLFAAYQGTRVRVASRETYPGRE